MLEVLAAIFIIGLVIGGYILINKGADALGVQVNQKVLQPKSFAAGKAMTEASWGFKTVASPSEVRTAILGKVAVDTEPHLVRARLTLV